MAVNTLNVAMESKSRNWGGARQGAGRKPAPVVRITLSVPREIWELLVTDAATKNMTPETLAVRWLEQYRNKDGCRDERYD